MTDIFDQIYANKSKIDGDIFDKTYAQQPKQSSNATAQIEPTENVPSQESPDNFLTSILRTLWQPISGAANMTPIPLLADILSSLGNAQAQEFLSEQIGDEMFKPELAQEIREQNEKYLPTLSNLESFVEEKTGLPLTPQNRAQRLLRLGGSGYKVLGKQGLSAPLFSETLKQSGLPEEEADFAGFGLSGIPARSSFTTPAKKPAQVSNTPKKSLNVTESSELPAAQKTSSTAKILNEESNIKNLPSKTSDIVSDFKNIEQITKAAENEITNTSLSSEKPPMLDPKRISKEAIDAVEAKITSEARTDRIIQEPQQEMGKIVHKNEFANDVIGGATTREQINKQAERQWENVGKLYDKTRNLYAEKEAIFPDLPKKLETVISELKELPQESLSTISKNILKKAEDLQNMLVEFAPGTKEITGYKPVKFKNIMDTIKEINTGAKYDFAQAVPAKKYNQLLKPLKESLAEKSAELKLSKAHKQYLKANEAHMNWKQQYEDKSILPFRNASKADELTELFKATEKFATIKNIENILGKSNPGTVGKLQRNYINKKLDPYYADRKKIGSRDYQRTISELNSTFPQLKKQITQIDKRLRSQKPKFTAKQMQDSARSRKIAESFKKAEKKTSDITDYSQQNIEKMLTSPRGIRQLREKLSEIGQPQLFEKLGDFRGNQIMREGEVLGRKMKGSDLYRILNNEKNYSQLVEIYGKEAVDTALMEAKKAAKQEDLIKTVGKIGKYAGKVTGLSKLVRLINIFV